MDDDAKGRKPDRRWIGQAGLGEAVRAVRERAGLTQKALADAAGLSPAAITRLESGGRRPTPQTLDAVAAALGLRGEQLIELAQHGVPDEELDALGPVATEVSDRNTEQTGYRPAPTSPGWNRLTAMLGPVESERLAATLAAWTETVGPDRAAATVTRLIEELGTRPAPLERVGSMPTGVVRHVFANAIGRDDDGHLWIDPKATIRRAGIPHEDPRVERFADGRIRLDLRRVELDIGPRRPEVHRTRTLGLTDDLTDRELAELADLYAATVIDLTLPDGTTRTIRRDDPTSLENLPEGASVIHIITAANPRSRLATDEENTERNRLLRRRLDDTGVRYLDAVGRSPDGSWTEESIATLDAPNDLIADLARHNEQLATFHWTCDELRTVWTPPTLAAGQHPVERGRAQE